MNHHLTDEQFAEVLSAEPGVSNANSAAAQHLHTCAPCREELDTLAQAFNSFRLASTQVAEGYTAEAPQVQRGSLLQHASAIRTSTRGFFARPQFAWAAGLVAVVALAAGSANLLHLAPNSANVAGTQPTVTQPAVIEAANTVSDDALLQSIEQDLSTSVAPSLEPLSTSSSAATTSSVSSNSKPAAAAANAD